MGSGQVLVCVQCGFLANRAATQHGVLCGQKEVRLSLGEVLPLTPTTFVL